jgi:hypothetical protein
MLRHRGRRANMRTRLLAISAFAAVLGAVHWSARAATNFNVTNNDSAAYTIDSVDNPNLTLTRGQTYTFAVNTSGTHPFWITTARGAAQAPTTNAFNQGVTNNGAGPMATVTFVVPASAPATLFYQCGFHDAMGGQLNIVNAAAVPSLGPVALATFAGALLLVAGELLRRRRQSTNGVTRGQV